MTMRMEEEESVERVEIVGAEEGTMLEVGKGRRRS